MINFIKQVFAVWVAIGLFMFFSLGIGIAFIAGLAATDMEAITVDSGSILHVSLNKPVEERPFDNPFEDFEIGGGTAAYGLFEIIGAIDAAATDDRIEGILLENKMIQAGVSSISEIRAAVERFKSSGKFVIAYSGDFMSEGAFYLASVADEVYIAPTAMVEFNGLTARRDYYKQMFSKIGVKPEIFRVGEYKSAVEMFMLDSMSAESRLQTEAYLLGMNDVILEDMARTTSIPKERLSEISVEMLGRSPESYQEVGLIDGVLYKDELQALLADKVGVDEPELLDVASYFSTLSVEGIESGLPKVAVVVADGGIGFGKRRRGNVGDEGIIKDLKDAREDDNVKAVVLRVNSPGGSAIASDNIWREVKLTAEKKPVIASMSDMAASGGYYIAMAADKIYCMPSTITGSVGIFAVTFDVTELMTDKLGVTFDGVQTGKYSNLWDMTEPMTEARRTIIQQHVDKGYEIFVSKAAEGRQVTFDELDKVARGRVWLGKDALSQGLVDQLGGINEAIAGAAEEAELSDGEYDLVFYPKNMSIWDAFLEDGFNASFSRLMNPEIPASIMERKERFEKIMQLNGVQSIETIEVTFD